jgi:biotin carboxylase
LVLLSGAHSGAGCSLVALGRGLIVTVLLFATTTGYQTRAFEQAAAALGIELLYATDRCHLLDDPWRDRAIPVRFHEPAASLDLIAAAAREQPFAGVLAVGDRPTVLAALAAERLGLPGHAPDAAAASGNKRATRDRFAASGLLTPWHLALPADVDAAGQVPPEVRFPCVLKPLGLSGSRGVIRADSAPEFDAARRRIAALLRRPDVRAARRGTEGAQGEEVDARILVEGFVAGREVAVEGVLTHGRLQVFAIFDKPDPLDGPFFEETIYVTPSALSGLSQVTVLRTVEAAATALGLWHGPVHAECRINADGIVMLEIAPRPIGGLCSKVLRFAGGLSLEQVLLHHAVDDDISGYLREASASAVMMIPIPARGIFKKVQGEEAAQRVPGVEEVVITAKPDQLLEPLPEAGSYLGFIFARAATAAQAERAVRDAHRPLRFTIDPEVRVNAIVEIA